jgi:hypothetical protein
MVMFWASSAFGLINRFDVVTMDCTADGSDPHFCQPQFDHLNWWTANGHYLAMGSDAKRPEVTAQSNACAVYYDTLTDLYNSGYTGAAAADQIQNYCVSNWSNNGVVPYWVVLNEISTSLWPGNSAYRTWLINCVTRLHDTYGHATILFSPFKNPYQNGADWQTLTAKCRIAIEGYLSGHDINASGNSVSWCQTQYQSFKNSYTALGVASSQLFIAENYAQTVSGTNWGRSGVSYAGWDNAINARTTAQRNVGFAGSIGYGWGKNAMLVSEADMVHFEYTYAQHALP